MSLAYPSWQEVSGGTSRARLLLRTSASRSFQISSARRASNCSEQRFQRNLSSADMGLKSPGSGSQRHRSAGPPPRQA